MTVKLPRAFSAKALPWVLLTVSLALNAFFVGGHVYGRYYAKEIYGASDFRKHRAGRRQAMMERLGLEADQQQAFRDMRREMREHGRTLHDKNRSDMEALWREMMAEAPDDRRIDTHLQSMAANRVAFQRQATRLAREFMAKLNPEQRTAFAEMAKAKLMRLGPGGGRGGSPIELKRMEQGGGMRIAPPADGSRN